MQHPTKLNTLVRRATLKPKYHFFKDGYWINDPNGLFFFDNLYHLFFQLNPENTVWGNIHWGHAVSNDLIRWEHKPIAIFAEPDGLGYIFSGGAIVDHQNTSGFAKEDQVPIVATFTQHSKTEEQVQSLAYSVDGGANFTMYKNNPVIPNPGLKDFRDPKVVRFEQDQVWIKSVVAGQCVHFYRSYNLRTWSKVSEFGKDYGSHGGVWECPDLFPLICSNTGRELWVLFISINPGGPNGGSATQYFIGEFDGKNFKPLDTQIRWLDYGTDCYAGITWDNTPQIKNQRTYVAWMSNWLYANKTPDDAWRGAMTLPRTVSLQKTDKAYVLRTSPAVSLVGVSKIEIEISDTTRTIPVSEAYSLHFSLENSEDVTTFSWENEVNEKFILTIDLKNKQILADRTNAGFQDNGFASVAKMPLEPEAGHSLQFDIFMDTCSFELFADGGKGCLTMLLFPTISFSQLEVKGRAHNMRIKELCLNFSD